MDIWVHNLREKTKNKKQKQKNNDTWTEDAFFNSNIEVKAVLIKKKRQVLSKIIVDLNSH